MLLRAELLQLYWEKLYKKAGELFGTENITIPTITRPWIVPGEIILRQGEDSAYIFKANMKVMLESDYLNSRQSPVSGLGSSVSGLRSEDMKDPRMKELNEYSSQLIRELIIPRLTKEVNISKRYAPLRQVFFSLVMARWFKDTFGSSGSASAPGIRAPESSYIKLIDSGDLTNLTSKEAWAKTYYFNEYKKSFEQGEYNLKEEIATPTGQVIRSYVSGGELLINSIPTGKVSLDNNRIPDVPGNVVSSSISEERRKLLSSQLSTYLGKKGLSQSFLEKLTRINENAIGEGMFVFQGKSIYFDYLEDPLFNDGSYLIRLSDENDYNVGRESVRILVSKEGISVKWKGEDMNLNYMAEFSAGIMSALSSQSSSSLTSVDSFSSLLTKEEIKKLIKDKSSGRDKHEGILVPASVVIKSGRQDVKRLKALAATMRELLQLPSSNETENLLWIENKLNNGEIDNYLLYIDGSNWDGNVVGIMQRDLPKGNNGYLAYLNAIGKDQNRKQQIELSLLNTFFVELRERGKETAVIDAGTKGVGKALETFLKGKGIGSLNYEEKGITVDVVDDHDGPFYNVPLKALASSAVGGIDFRQMNYLVQPMGSFKDLQFGLPTLSSSALERIDLDKELESLRNMVKNGMVPSGMRVKEYLAACFQKGKIEEKQDDLLVCLAEIYRLAEEENLETSPELRESLVIVDTGKFALLPNNQKVGLN